MLSSRLPLSHPQAPAPSRAHESVISGWKKGEGDFNMTHLSSFVSLKGDVEQHDLFVPSVYEEFVDRFDGFRSYIYHQSTVIC